MTYYEIKIKALEAKLKAKQEELDEADEYYYDEVSSAKCWNFWLVGAIVCLALWIATHTCTT